MRWFGFTVALLVGLGGLYEALAIVHPDVPTISRVVQGWRDSGAVTAVTVLTLAILGALAYFARWLWEHFRRGTRSTL